MFHNSGGYGPGGNPANANMREKSPKINSPAQVNQNMGNLSDIAQQQLRSTSERYDVPVHGSYNYDISSYNPNLSTFAAYQNRRLSDHFDPNSARYGDLNWQSSFATHMHNVPFQNMAHFLPPYEAARLSSEQRSHNLSNSHLTESLMYNKHKDIFSHYNQSFDPQKQSYIMDPIKQKNLENTVKLLGNIISNSSTHSQASTNTYINENPINYKNSEYKDNQTLRHLLGHNDLQNSHLKQSLEIEKLKDMEQFNTKLQHIIESSQRHTQGRYYIHENYLHEKQLNKTEDIIKSTKNMPQKINSPPYKHQEIPNIDNYPPNKDNYPHNLGNYLPRKDNVLPNKNNYQSESDNFPPTVINYSHSHNPNDQDNFLSNKDNPPNKNNYPPNEDNYPHFKDNYSPKKDKFPSNKDNYLPESYPPYNATKENRNCKDNYPVNKDNYPPNKDNYPPSEDNVPPNDVIYLPNKDSFRPNKNYSQNQDNMPSKDYVPPNIDNYLPNKDNYPPNQDNYEPKRDTYPPSKDNVSLKKDNSFLNQDNSEPNKDNNPPSKDNVLHNEDNYKDNPSNKDKELCEDKSYKDNSNEQLKVENSQLEIQNTKNSNSQTVIVQVPQKNIVNITNTKNDDLIKNSDNQSNDNTDDENDMSENDEILTAEMKIEVEEHKIELNNSTDEKELTTQDGDDFSTVFLRDTNMLSKKEAEMGKIVGFENSIQEATKAINNGPSSTYYECQYCNYYFRHPKRFLIHVKWHTFGMANVKRKDIARQQELEKQQYKTAKTQQCDICEKQFKTLNSLTNHKQKFHSKDVECQICHTKVSGVLELRAHTKASHPQPWVCRSCGRHCSNKYTLAKHTRVHLEKHLSCHQCDKLFATETQLKDHQRVHERIARGAIYKCSYCDKSFYQTYNLQAHEKTHSKERPFSCDICNTKFSTNSTLKRHVRVSHNTDKPYACSECSRCFAEPRTLVGHMSKAHPGSGVLGVKAAKKLMVRPRKRKSNKNEDIFVTEITTEFGLG